MDVDVFNAQQQLSIERLCALLCQEKRLCVANFGCCQMEEVKENI
jgi:hypothetical protein